MRELTVTKFSKSSPPQVAKAVFSFKSDVFQIPRKVSKYMGFFRNKICLKDLLKIGNLFTLLSTYLGWNIFFFPPFRKQTSNFPFNI